MLSIFVIGGGKCLAYSDITNEQNEPCTDCTQYFCDAHTPLKGEWAIKSNLLHDLNTTLSLGVELPIGRHWSFDLSADYNPWTFSEGRKWKHWLVQPELRLWTRRALQGHFFALHALGGEYNVNKIHLPFDMYRAAADRRFQGWAAGAGLAYGYRWNFSSRWGMEAEVGLGAVYSKWDKFCPVNCGVRTGTGSGIYFTPTKLALNLVYRFGKSGKKNLPQYRHTPADTVYIERVMRDTVYLQSGIINPSDANASIFHLSFPWSSAEIDHSLHDNGAQMEAIQSMITNICTNPDIQVKSIRITGYASPEGNATLNQTLSEQRAESVAAIIRSRCPQLSSLIQVKGMGEDWNGVLQNLDRCPDENGVATSPASSRPYRSTTVVSVDSWISATVAPSCGCRKKSSPHFVASTST